MVENNVQMFMAGPRPPSRRDQTVFCYILVEQRGVTDTSHESEQLGEYALPPHEDSG